MKTIDYKKVKSWMYLNYKDYLDKSDCLNTTVLAECACNHFNGYDGDDTPEEFFEVAAEVDMDLFRQKLVNE